MRVLAIHPFVHARGGGQTVAAWTLQALRDVCDLSLLTWADVDYAGVNTTFGTSLRHGDFHVHLVPEGMRRILRAFPSTGSQMLLSLIMRAARRLDRMERYDVLLSTTNEFDFGRPGIQYVHFPWRYLPRPKEERRWYHRPPGAVAIYRALCALVGGVSPRRIRENLTLVNSRFIGQKVREAWSIPSRVLPPPVPGGFPAIPWNRRENGFVCLGRIARGKRLLEIVDILARVRARGHEVKLYLAGTRDDPGYEQRIRARVEGENWIELHLDLPRDRLVELVAGVRYAVHGMIGEHFGIVVAEYLHAGCIPFVPDSGGPVEIVGGDGRLLYGSTDEAVDKIDRVLRDRELQGELQGLVAQRSRLFGSEHFAKEMREVVTGFEARGSA